jgi:hypothetical protein
MVTLVSYLSDIFGKLSRLNTSLKYLNATIPKLLI